MSQLLDHQSQLPFYPLSDQNQHPYQLLLGFQFWGYPFSFFGPTEPEDLVRDDPLIAAGRIHAVNGAPRYPLPAYVVYPKELDNPVIPLALEGLRSVGRFATLPI